MAKRYSKLPSEIVKSGSSIDVQVANLGLRYENFLQKRENDKANGNVSKESFNESFGDLVYTWSFNPINGALRSGISSGEIHLINNDRLLELLFSWEDVVKDSEEEIQKSKEEEISIEDMELSIRAYNCLKREGIHTVGELVNRSEADLLDIRNFGSKSIDEVKAKLVSMGMSLKDSPVGFDPTQHQNYNASVDDDFVDAEQA